MAAPASAPTIGGKVTVGLNFEASRFNTALPVPTGGTLTNGFTPPDTMGAVGPHHIVLMINGEFSVFDKSTGAVLERRSLDSFWANKVTPGQSPQTSFTFDPRIIYDPVNEIFFAVSSDGDIDTDGDGISEIPSNIFVARSDTSDPTGVWRAFSFPGDTSADGDGNPEFHDYPTLGMNADGIYICTQDFGDPAMAGFGDESCYSIPKADVMANPPTAANLTRFIDTPTGLQAISGSWQPVVDHGLSLGRNALFGSDGANLRRSDIFGATGPGATLGTPTGIAGDPGHADAPNARQPDDGNLADTGERIENVAPRFVGNLVVVDGFVWGVHSVLGTGGNAALRWYKIDEATNAVVDGGRIEDTSRDFHEPSIAVNDRGQVVIGYSCSGPTLPVSACTSVGEIDSGTGDVVFEPPAILHTGTGVYWRDRCTPTVANPCSERNRWGDYSATVVDPSDSCTFWTFQEYTAVGGAAPLGPSTDADGGGEGGLWGVRITQLTFDGCVGADVAVTKICKPDGALLAGNEGFCTIFVDNLGPGAAQGVQVVDAILSDGVFDIGTVTTTAGTCSATPNPQTNSGEVTCELGWLDPGDRVTIKVPVSADSAQTINDFVTVSSDSADPNLANNQDTGSITVVAAADLSLTKMASASVIAGTNLTYLLKVTNNGPSTASNVVISDVLPAGVSIVSVSSNGGGSCNGGVPGDAALPTTCTFDSLEVGIVNSETMTISVKVLPETTGILHNNASVSSDTADPDNSNDLATVATTVDTEADLVVVKSDSPDPVLAGNQLTYTIAVTNNGPSVSRAVKLTDTLPAQVSFVSATADNGAPCVEVQPGIVECSLGDLNVGQTVTVHVDVKVDPSVPDGTTITNNVNVTSLTTDPGAATATEDTLVNTAADLWMEKTGLITSGSTKNAGNSSGTVVYHLIVHNNNGCAADDGLQCGDGGPSDALNVVVMDMLPEDPKKFVVEVVSEACTYNGALHKVTCITPVLPVNQIVVHEIQGKVKGNAGVITNVATVSSTTTDPNPGNNSHSKELTIGGGKGNKGGKP